MSGARGQPHLAFDLIHRVWLDLGHHVDYVQNITDVDDPLLERAARDHQDWRALAARETALFREDMSFLRILPPRHHVGAVEAMARIIDMIADLVAAGVAYRDDRSPHPDVYFDVDAGGPLGVVSGYETSVMLRLAAQGDGESRHPGRRRVLDPVIWRAHRDGEPAWESALGPGRPGWHVQCSAIARHFLGDRIDLAGGGRDLVFPHHDCSAAHVEALSGARPFAACWTHTGMVGLEGEKMSKSRGHLVLVSSLRDRGVDAGAVRLALLDGHYRSDREWTEERLRRAQRRLHRWRSAITRPSGPPATELTAVVRSRLADDLDTPGALAAVDGWADAALGGGNEDESAPGEVRALADGLLGVALQEAGVPSRA
ncbi:cysteine--1-D-myo-inosityl 2-amino-2-deoxy-alpha-D-glucopyranoside ligase [Actinomycetospora sp. NBC_00405]